MLDRDEFLARFERERQEREAAARATLADLSGLLWRLGVRAVTAPYDGHGDQGAVERLRYDPSPPAGLPAGLDDAVRDAVYGLLPSDWEINEGSTGTVTLDTATGTTTIKHHWREDEPDDWEFELELDDDPPPAPPAKEP